MKKLITLSLFIATLFLTGCLNITEELFLEKNGSGSFSTKLEFTKLDEMMQMLKQFATDDAKSGELKSIMSDTLSKMSMMYQNIPGITNIETIRPDSSSIIIRFKFKDLQALNIALKKRMDNNQEDVFSFSQHTFVCNDKSLAELNKSFTGINKQKGATMPNGMEMPEIDPEQVKGMFSMLGWDMTKKAIYHLPSPVTEYSNKNAVLSDDKKTITLDVNLLNDYKTKTFVNTIKLQ